MTFERLRQHKETTSRETDKSRLREHNKAYGRWPVFQSGVASYFSCEDDESHISFLGLDNPTDIRKRLEKIKGSGPIKGVDVMGQGQVCKDLGCDVAFGVTLDNQPDDAGLDMI